MLKSKHLAVVFVALFFLSLIFSSIIVQVATGVLTETRKSVLIKTLCEMQLNGGSFGYPGLWNPYLEVTTACTLIVFETLNALDRIDINEVVEYLVSQQDPVSGGFGKIIDEQGTFLVLICT